MGLLKTVAKVGVATSVHGRVQRRQEAKWAQPVQAAPPAPVQQAAPDHGAALAQLKQLGELRDAGILTDAEFEAKKAIILSS